MQSPPLEVFPDSGTQTAPGACSGLQGKANVLIGSHPSSILEDGPALASCSCGPWHTVAGLFC